ncbi:MAG: hypothetical protein R3181_14260 [Rubricoccaceae bacterium]|nr:hypothetical protein [Rubricoccaceae bacterium]
MPARRLLVLLLSVGLAACAAEPDAPSPAGTENPAEVPVEMPPERRTVPGGAEPGREPGVPGSDRAEDAWALDDGACYAYPGYVVRVRPRPSAPGEDVTVFQRHGEDARAQCDTAPGDALFAAADADRPTFFFGPVGDHVLPDEGTGPGGRALRIVDLKIGATVYEADYEEPAEVRDGTLLYGMAPEVAESMAEVTALGVDCEEAGAWFDEGLRVGLSPEVRYDFDAGIAAPTGAVRCVPIQ